MSKINFSNPSTALLSGILIIILALCLVLIGLGYGIASLIMSIVA
jgi:hypothetical protein